MENREILKLIAEPVWKPACIIANGIRNTIPDIRKTVIDTLKEEDGINLWGSFTCFSVIVSFIVLVTVPFFTPFVAVIGIAFAILFPIYLLLYYARKFYTSN